MKQELTRRGFLGATTAMLAGGALPDGARGDAAEPIIDIHQHQGYKGRTTAQFRAHQRAMGVTMTVILPSARAFDRNPDGSWLDPERHRVADNEAAVRLVREHPSEFVRFANELPTDKSRLATIESFLRNGGRGIGESKFKIDCDSRPIEALAELAQSFGVPVLMHFQHKAWNLHIERFDRILKRYPKVNFIGHAQTWWGNIDKNHDQKVLYPKGKVTPGGLTDRLLAEYPNMFGDLSAGSGNNSLIRDEEHARGFLERHQDKLMFGSDCNDLIGRGKGCTGARTIAAVRRLAGSKEIERKILHGNARRLLKV